MSAVKVMVKGERMFTCSGDHAAPAEKHVPPMQPAVLLPVASTGLAPEVSVTVLGACSGHTLAVPTRLQFASVPHPGQAVGGGCRSVTLLIVCVHVAPPVPPVKPQSAVRFWRPRYDPSDRAEALPCVATPAALIVVKDKLQSQGACRTRTWSGEGEVPADTKPEIGAALFCVASKPTR